jgi:hypothetical protein
MSKSALEVGFEREAFEVEGYDATEYKSRCKGCPDGTSPGGKFCIGCCLPFTWMCWNPSKNHVSKVLKTEFVGTFFLLNILENRVVCCCASQFAIFCWEPSFSGELRDKKANLIVFHQLFFIFIFICSFLESNAAGIPFGQQAKWTYGNSVYFVFIALTTYVRFVSAKET